MVDISAAIATAKRTIGDGTSSSVTGTAVNDNFDTFLSLLTTQLQNQDPTDPVDTNEFTQQLIQYTEVEQLIQTNKKLEALLNLAAADTALSVIGYVGKEITTKGSTTNLANNGTANWGLEVPANSGDVTYVVKDASGNEVYSSTGSLEAGSRSFAWDGTNSSGGTAAPGIYSLTVTAKNAAGDNVPVEVSVKGIVDGVDTSGDAPTLLVNGARFEVDDVTRVRVVS